MTSLIRAALVKIELDAIAKLPEAPQILPRIRPATLARVREAGALSWIAIEDDLEVLEAAAILPPARFQQIVSVFTEDAGKQPILAGAMKLAIRMTGSSPRILIKNAPTTWPLTYQNFGKLEIVSLEESRAEFHWVNAPAVGYESKPFLSALSHGMASSFVLFRKKCSIEYVVKAAEQRVEFRAAWR